MLVKLTNGIAIAVLKRPYSQYSLNRLVVSNTKPPNLGALIQQEFNPCGCYTLGNWSAAAVLVLLRDPG